MENEMCAYCSMYSHEDDNCEWGCDPDDCEEAQRVEEVRDLHEEKS